MILLLNKAIYSYHIYLLFTLIASNVSWFHNETELRCYSRFPYHGFNCFKHEPVSTIKLNLYQVVSFPYDGFYINVLFVHLSIIPRRVLMAFTVKAGCCILFETENRINSIIKFSISVIEFSVF